MRPTPPRATGWARPLPSALTRRQRPFILCALVSIALLLLIHVAQAGPLAVALAGAASALLLAAFVSDRPELARPAALAAGATALWLPLGPVALAGAGLPPAIEDATIWPNVLVLLFASRLLAQAAQRQFLAFWHAPRQRPSRTGPQSLAAALLLGLALALTFYHFLGVAPPAPSLDPVSVTHRALAGGTIVHVAIVALFFVTLAAIGDAAILLLEEKAFVAHLRRQLQAADVSDRAGACALPSKASHLRAFHVVQAASREGTRSDAHFGERGPLDEYHLAARRLMRQFLTFMPLLGFLGTVIGLAVAIGALGSDTDAPGIDLAASLAGLSIQFETTLLGLLGGLLGQFALALLEKRETELWAECEHMVKRQDGPNAA